MVRSPPWGIASRAFVARLQQHGFQLSTVGQQRCRPRPRVDMNADRGPTASAMSHPARRAGRRRRSVRRAQESRRAKASRRRLTAAAAVDGLLNPRGLAGDLRGVLRGPLDARGAAAYDLQDVVDVVRDAAGEFAKAVIRSAWAAWACASSRAATSRRTRPSASRLSRTARRSS
jgi:hypothetical protein